MSYFKQSGGNNSDSDSDSELKKKDIDEDNEEENEEDIDEDEDESEEEEIEEEEQEDNDLAQGDDENVKAKPNKIQIPTNKYIKPDDEEYEEDEEEDEYGENYLQKFENYVDDNYILNFHPESISQNYDEILSMTKVVRNQDGIIIDKLHKTIPFLTKYERARIIGQRAKQINTGAYPFVSVPEKVIDGYLIAEMELAQNKIPFIIRRPLPNGGSEYWKVNDLENISF
jgi:DNA-directed RNA polymerase I, II, and III subunit RPABC2